LNNTNNNNDKRTIECERTDSIVGIRDNNLDKKQTLPVITLTNTDGKRACDSLVIDATVPDVDGMLNLISNDLDYLLNRRHEVPPLSSSESHQHHSMQQQQQQQLPAITPPPPAAYASNQSKNQKPVQHDVIIEESEHEVDS